MDADTPTCQPQRTAEREAEDKAGLEAEAAEAEAAEAEAEALAEAEAVVWQLPKKRPHLKLKQQRLRL